MRRLVAWPSLVLAVGLVGACTGDPPPVAETPPEVGENEDGWPLPNRDYHSTRATFDSSIDSSSVHRLEEVWTYDLGVGAPTNPIVIDSTVYLADQGTSVHAIDIETGERKWRKPEGKPVFGPNGVSVGWGKVFSNDGGTAITAYDSSTGEEIWSTGLLDNGGAVNFQPLPAQGMVLAATSSLSDPGGRGTLFALDQGSGEIVWSFDTIESEDLWGRPQVNSGGGAWFPPALHGDLTFWGTSNPYPFPGSLGAPNGASRPGDNRWTNSLLAIGLASGELKWGHQVVPHDLFDYDSVIVAIAETSEGLVVINTGKHGRILGFSTDGKVLWDVPVGVHQNDRLDAIVGEVEVYPGILGGVITPVAVADETVYAVAVNAPTEYRSAERGADNVGLGTRDSQVVAVDANDGSVVWDVTVPGDAFGGATVINDLVVTSLIDGRVLALDRSDGTVVWEYQASGGINGWPAVVDDYLLVPVGLGASPHLLALKVGGNG